MKGEMLGSSFAGQVLFAYSGTKMDIARCVLPNTIREQGAILIWYKTIASPSHSSNYLCKKAMGERNIGLIRTTST